jgi:hypothetical protein
MKSFKLVLTGSAILMCVILVSNQKITGTSKRVQPAKYILQKQTTAIYSGDADPLIYPWCSPLYLPY